MSIRDWTVAERRVQLFREGDIFRCKSTPPLDEELTFRSALFSSDDAEKLVHLFSQTIKKNLEIAHKISSSCFLPKACIKVHQEPNLRVALFENTEQTDTETTVANIIFGATESEGQTEWTLSANDTISKQFIANAPLDNRADLRPLYKKKWCFSNTMTQQYDKQGKPVMVEGEKHFRMDAYARKFIAVVKRNPTDQNITSIALQHVSRYDPAVIIDNDSWAVTLLSAKAGTSTGYFAVGGSSATGHSMLACEQVEGNTNEFSTTYLHITTVRLPSEGYFCERGSGEARVETRKTGPSVFTHGPTWSLSKDRVSQLISSTKEKERRLDYVRFSIAGAARSIAIDLLYAFATGASIVERRFYREASVEEASFMNCTGWCLQALKDVGIEVHIPIKKRLTLTPNSAVDYFLKNPSAATIL